MTVAVLKTVERDERLGGSTPPPSASFKVWEKAATIDVRG